mmetsp:Transcript_40198/g.75191  ORF Transcript_40198/g.75191 Transcript_40198/m.75191 type:complete len:163 (-) Transcript_40198:41-529(-)
MRSFAFVLLCLACTGQVNANDCREIFHAYPDEMAAFARAHPKSSCYDNNRFTVLKDLIEEGTCKSEEKICEPACVSALIKGHTDLTTKCYPDCPHVIEYNVCQVKGAITQMCDATTLSENRKSSFTPIMAAGLMGAVGGAMATLGALRCRGQQEAYTRLSDV